MKQIDVEGIPDRIVCILQTMIDALRNNCAANPDRAKTKTDTRELPRIHGTVIGSLSRRDIYEDAG